MSFVRKDLWLATNFAVKMIKQTGYRNKSIKKAAEYYGVSVEEVKKEINKRISRSTKGKKRGSFKKYIFEGNIGIGNEVMGIETIKVSLTFRALNRTNAKRLLIEKLNKKFGDSSKRTSNFEDCFEFIEDLENNLHEL